MSAAMRTRNAVLEKMIETASVQRATAEPSKSKPGPADVVAIDSDSDSDFQKPKVSTRKRFFDVNCVIQNPRKKVLAENAASKSSRSVSGENIQPRKRRKLRRLADKKNDKAVSAPEGPEESPESAVPDQEASDGDRAGVKGEEREEIDQKRKRAVQLHMKRPKDTGKVKDDCSEGSSKSSSSSSRKMEKDSGKSAERGSDIKPLRLTSVCRFVEDAVKVSEAIIKWPHRYQSQQVQIQSGEENSSGRETRIEPDKDFMQSTAHYQKAEVDGQLYELGDCVHVNSDSGPDYIGKITEMFEGVDGNNWFTSQWFYRAGDTVIGQDQSSTHDEKRVFISKIKDDNLLECITSKLNVLHVQAMTRFQTQRKPMLSCDFYYDMGYDIDFSTFHIIPDILCAEVSSSDSASTISSDELTNLSVSSVCTKEMEGEKTVAKKELSLLDLYSGCGAMSTGLCSGAALAGVNLVTRWAVDLNEYACRSLKHNHPDTQVRNESAEDFFALIKEWEVLCKRYLDSRFYKTNASEDQLHEDCESATAQNETELDEGFNNIDQFVGIRWHKDKVDRGSLQFKVRRKGCSEEDDHWMPYKSLMQCEKRIKAFVNQGRRNRILPLPGDVDVICGGPPCQGASGFNRFRNTEAPLDDPKNHQIVVFMDIVGFLKPRFVLMENVVDILKFAEGFLGRYALSRVVEMHYQAKIGIMVAGCYGLPQFRMRAFLWGACSSESLPPFPLPTHDVVVRGFFPISWEHNVVAYDERNRPKLDDAILLGDAISDLPPVHNSERRDEIPYNSNDQTKFQQYMRLSKEALEGNGDKSIPDVIYDHRPLKLNNDDYQRTCQIPKEKGANFRNLKGVIVRPDKTVELDLENRVMLPSGKPLVPDYAITFCRGRSSKPFGRLWWDEIIPTVVTRAEPHNQIILHPEQDRVLTIRENARIQGFPDYYQLFGKIKQRYMQVGNAVAVPVSRALGYELGLAIRKQCVSKHLAELPKGFPLSLMPADG